MKKGEIYALIKSGAQVESGLYKYRCHNGRIEKNNGYGWERSLLDRWEGSNESPNSEYTIKEAKPKVLYKLY